VHIKQITADRNTYAAGAKLPALVREVEIDYTALSFVAPEKNRFRYKLEGYDRDWQEAGNRREAFYTNLFPRNYRFRVIAANNDGVWNEAGASLDFSVAPAYFQTTWFRLSVVAAVLAVLAGMYRLRLLYLKRQFDIRFEERVNERMRLARDLHDTLLQSFQGVLLKFHAVTFALPDRPAEARKSLESAIEQARAAVTEGRDAVQGLRSSTVVKNDLARAITTFGEGLASDQNGGHAPDFRVEVEGTSRDLAPLVQDEVYRIAGEALRNAFRQAGARRIEVGIHYEKWLLRVRVRDNGKGIDPHVVDAGGRGGHHGLPGMRERADLVGGKLAVWSELNSGTEIELTIPSNIAYAKSLDAQPAASAGQPT
jgi:signal transduction histidine kinase